MKPVVAALLVPLLVAVVNAQTAPAKESDPANKPATAPAPASRPKIILGTKTAPASGAKTMAAEAKATAAKKAAADKAAKKEEPPKIEVMEIGRGAKGFLGLQVVGGNFKLSFYDAKKKPVAPDVVRAVLRWTPNYKPGTEIYVLGAGDGKSLSAPKTVRAPYSFKLFMSLFVEGEENPVESYVVDFRQ